MAIQTSNAVAPGATLGITAETVIATLPSVFLGRALLGVLMRGTVIVQPGTGATGVTLRCRLGSVSGPLVDQAYAYSGMTAGNRYSASVEFLDSSSNAWDVPGGATYVITAQQTGAPTVAGTASGGRIHVED